MDYWNKDMINQLLSLAAIALSLVATSLNLSQQQKVQSAQGFVPTVTIAPTPTPFEPFPYKVPQIQNARSYRIMLVGDSIVGSLGPNAQLLRQHLIELYPDHEFVNYNYGFGATSIETLPDRLTKETEYKGTKYPAILFQDFDLIIIESFAYNPLSQEAAGEGLTKHLKILDESVRQIIKEKPNSAVAVLTPIAPSRTRFARGVYELTQEERDRWVDDRVSYIKGVIDYAQEKNIPLINIYEKTLNANGDGNLRYINPDDYIHPSAEGVDVICKTIAQFIYDNKIFPE